MQGSFNLEKTKKTKFRDNERRDPKRDKNRDKHRKFDLAREKKRSYE